MNKRESLFAGLIILIAVFAVIGSMSVISAKENDSDDSNLSVNAGISIRGDADSEDNDDKKDIELEYDSLLLNYTFKYSTFNEAVIAFKAELNKDLMPTYIAFYVPGKVPREDGSPYFILMERSDVKEKCSFGYFNLVTGTGEFWESACVVTDSDDNSESDEDKINATSANANCTIRIEREIRVNDGIRTEIVKRRIKCADGVESEFKLRIENSTVDGRLREKFRYEINGKELEIEAEDEIDLEENTSGEYRLRARLRNGNYTDIKIMPDAASEIAIERLRLKVCSDENNCTIQIRERIHNNVPQVVYNIDSNTNGKFLGIFKIAMRANAEVDPETGEVLDVNAPWWAFLVARAETDANADAAGGTFLENSSDADTNDTNNAAA